MESFAYAKINLYLNVLGKREDGFHEVCMVMQAIRLADRVTVTPAISNQVTSNSRYVPNNPSNLAMQAAMAMQKAYGLGPVAIDLHKAIPVSAGLAGGSSDAGQVILLMDRLFGLQAPMEDLLAIGASLGSDIPFCMQGPTALAIGRGEKLLNLPPLPKRHLVLVKPDFPVSTAKVYGHYGHLPSQEKTSPRRDFSHTLSALLAGAWDQVLPDLFNALEPATFSLYPKVEKIKKDIQNIYSGPVLMSGSGPTIFCVLEGAEEAWDLYKVLSKNYPQTFLTTTLEEAQEAWA